MDQLKVPNLKHCQRKMERNDERAGAQADTPTIESSNKETLEISNLAIYHPFLLLLKER